MVVIFNLGPAGKDRAATETLKAMICLTQVRPERVLCQEGATARATLPMHHGLMPRDRGSVGGVFGRGSNTSGH